MSQLQELKNLGFRKAGVIHFDSDAYVNYLITEEEFKENKGQVYAWVVDEEILYIGMAGKGINKRLSEHKGGWKGGSTTGVTKRKLLIEELNNSKNGQVDVYGYTSSTYTAEVPTILGTETIELSAYSLDEDLLIEKFKPVWNVNGK